MKRNVLFGSILAAALSVGVGAQSGAGSAQTPDRAGSKANQAVTVTGCLQPADSATGTSGTTAPGGATASRTDFILSNATAGAGASAAASSPGAPTGTSGTAPSASAAQYKLAGGSKDDLRRYLNSTVEITGKVDNASATTGSASPGSPSATAAPGSMATGARGTEAGPTLNVDSVRQISPTCTR